jgi:hypothetical protein
MILAPEPDSGLPLTFSPETVTRSTPREENNGGKGKKGRDLKPLKNPRKKIRVKHKAKAAKPKAPKSISTAMVQEKFRMVRLQYTKFTRSYGKLLDEDWQKILFANTYGNMDENKNRRLNEMLDELLRKMKQVR